MGSRLPRTAVLEILNTGKTMMPTNVRSNGSFEILGRTKGAHNESTIFATPLCDDFHYYPCGSPGDARQYFGKHRYQQHPPISSSLCAFCLACSWHYISPWCWGIHLASASRCHIIFGLFII